MILEFPPKDCDGNALACGDSVHFMLTNDRAKQVLTLVQITAIAQENGRWKLDGLTPFGTCVSIEGVEHVRKVQFPVPQLQEGENLVERDRKDDRPD